MKFCWTTLHVQNMETSLKFYEEIIGLVLNRRYSPREGMEIAFLGAGDTQVELISDINATSSNMGKDISMGFITESLENTMKLLGEKGYSFENEVIKPNPHIQFFYMLDPNGLKIQFVEMLA